MHSSSNVTASRRAAARPSAGVRAWLVRLVALCMLPTAVVAAAYLTYDFLTGREALLRDAQGTARVLTAAIDRDLFNYQAALTALASSPFLERDDLRGFHEQASRVVAALKLNNLVLIDRRFQQVDNTLRPYGAALPVEGNAALRDVFNTGRPVVTDLFVGAVLQRPLLAVAVPVMRNGRVAYVLAAGVWPDRLSELLRQQNLPPDWVGGIFDGTGSIVARTHEIDRFLGQKAARPLVNQMLAQAEGRLEMVTLEGIPVVTVFSRSAASRWSVAIGVPRAPMLQQLERSLMGLAGAGVLLLAMALLGAWRMSRIITRSVRGLLPYAHALGRGESFAALPSPVAEVNEVIAALGRASRVLQQALHRARHDALTDLPNATLFHEMAQQQLAVCRRKGDPLAILFLDLDGFKTVNDRYGHALGDALLKVVSTRLSTELRQADVLARLSGDEFAVLLPGTGAPGALEVAEKLSNRAAMPWTSDEGVVVAVSASIGLALYPEDGTALSALLDAADSAMYEAKARGKGRVVRRRGGRDADLAS